ncbi:hypothetical protein CC86DRAFT_470527 [Ophiobolus disseminans]|uniref:BTB domain-containing protein n=1 Tax=Ophiobolus disseminans TaxID=1469910 RepID=A0A6A6ZND3_9PLEO|nr:hypothetical protein CC86DRAFT_470527 [Ophiobolus disseminans]
MALSMQFVRELVRTRNFSDFTFKVPIGEDHELHKVILAATSPVLGRFLLEHDKEADLFELFVDSSAEQIKHADDFTKLALCAGMSDVFAFCYLGDYKNSHRDGSSDFDVRVMSHLLTHDLAHRFQIGGLVELTSCHFKKAFLWYCANSTSEDVKVALQECSAPNFVKDSGLTGHALNLLHDTALAAFANQVGAYKTNGRFREALELMEAVPLATAELYSRRSIQAADAEGSQEGDEEEDEYVEVEGDEDREEVLQEDGTARSGTQ